MKRSVFLKQITLASSAIVLYQSCLSKRKITGKILGANSKIGHLLRTQTSIEEVNEVEYFDTVIVGGGISGLSAARFFKQNNHHNFLLLELETEVGGNSKNHENEVSKCPTGAHYVPIANIELKEYLRFLEECKVITHYDENNLPFYNEYYLCFKPEERLFINGTWQEGLVPHFGVPKEEQKEIESFFKIISELKNEKDDLGNYIFSIPILNTTNNSIRKKLDGITMLEWLKEKEFSSNYLIDYINYCCRDDFGTSIDEISAFVGLHYFAARRGIASNAEYNDVLTWPEGNGFFVDKLKLFSKENTRTSSLVRNISNVHNKIEVTYLDVNTGKTKKIISKNCILATPQFINNRILNFETNLSDFVKSNFQYSPWMVANIIVDKLEEKSEITLSWDNVIYKNKSLGYVNATHQNVNQVTDKTVLTFYLPLTDLNSKIARQNAANNTYDDWVKIILKDLKVAHPTIENYIHKIDINIWGHAMAKPTANFITKTIPDYLERTKNSNLYFAHTDIAGISIFEEAFYQGLNAAKKVLAVK